MSHKKLDLENKDFNLKERQEKIRLLQQAFPNAFKDNKLDPKIIVEELRGEIADPEEEQYGLNWPGKAAARRIALTPPQGTLVPCPGEGVNEDSTENIFIEGENLEVLKLLQKSYAGKIKMIYIDPPYNTGNDFVYSDDFTQPIEEYLRITGQTNDDGRSLVTNKKTDGRFHSKWMSMIYPRLKLARNLLRDDGVIFVSIDDNEIHNLRAVLNEIFGEENFRGLISRGTGTPTGQGTGRLVNELDYMLCYAKNEAFEFVGLEFDAEDEKIYDQEDNKGRYLTRPLRKTGGEDRREDRPTMFYSVIAPTGEEIWPYGPGGYESRWRCGKARYDELLSNGFIEWKKTKDGNKEIWKPFQKFYLEGRTKQASNLWNDLEGNKKATRQITEILGEKVFDFPKPTDLMEKVIEISTNEDCFVMDFFAGSATSAHSLLALNAKSKVLRRKFILVQIPEKIPENSIAKREKYQNLAEIGKERIRRVIKKLKKENPEAAKKTDIGFKVFKLSRSNYSKWQETDDLAKVKDQLFASAGKKEFQSRDLLTEILLAKGFPLTARTEERKIGKNQVCLVSHEWRDDRLFCCFDKSIDKALAENPPFGKRDHLVCFDDALTDELKVRLSELCELRTI